MSDNNTKHGFAPTRRSLLTAAGALGAAGAFGIAAPAVISPARAQGRRLYVNTWGGSWTAAQDAAFFKPFTQATGIAVEPVAPVSYAKLRAQVQSGVYEWDVTSMTIAETLRANNEGLLDEVDLSIIDQSKLFEGAIVGNSITTNALGTNLAYRTDKYGDNPPKTWADFWDVEKFPGDRSLVNNPVRCLVFALIADGIAPKDMTFPIDLDRAFRKLDQIKPHIKVWWTQGNQSQQLLRDGEVDMIAIWNARGTELKEQGVPCEVVWHGATVHVGSWVVAKGAPNRDLGWQFIQFCAQPENQAEFCKRMYYGPTNQEAYKYIPESAAREMPTYPANAEVAVHVDPEWESRESAAIHERFTQWLAG